MPWRARSTPNWPAPVALRRVLTALPRDVKRNDHGPGPGSPTQAGGTAMDYATGLGHRRSAASPAPSARRPATVFVRIAITAAPPAMPQASVLGDNGPAPAEPAVHTWRMVTFRREIRPWHETGVTQRH
jgi:hypothetical protein